MSPKALGPDLLFWDVKNILFIYGGGVHAHARNFLELVLHVLYAAEHVCCELSSAPLKSQ